MSKARTWATRSCLAGPIPFKQPWRSNTFQLSCGWTGVHRQAQVRLWSLSVPKVDLPSCRTNHQYPSLARYGQCGASRLSSRYHSNWTLDKSFDKHTAERPTQNIQPLLPYKTPTVGVLSYLPRSWVPYAELIRLDKPTGTYYLLFPCLFSTLMAASYSGAPVPSVVSTSALFAFGALIMRGAGCTINDLWDRNLDPHVARTRLRPIARGAVTSSNAIVFTGLQLIAGLGVLVQFPPSCLLYGIPSLVLVASYPLAKRVTHYPQFVLGLTFSWGAIMGFPALGIDLLADALAIKTVTALYASCVSWTVLYDMIYAHMDLKDDRRIGIKSIALRHAKRTKAVLSGLAVTQIGLLSAAGTAMGAGPIFFVTSCGSAAASLGFMIWKVNLEDVSSCWWWFKNGAWFTGGGITAGLLGDYFVSIRESQSPVNS